MPSRILRLSLWPFVLAASTPPVMAAPVAHTSSGEQLYLRACASCHGEDGEGAPPATVGFTVPVPDFRECAFTTAEPLTDWFAVTHQGGPARGFDRTMPAFGQTLSEADIMSVLGHMKTFCPDAAWPAGELNLPRPLFTEKAYPENELVLTTFVALRGTGSVISELVYEQRVGARAQLELRVPFGFLEGDAGGWRTGLGDLSVALKQAVVHSLRTGSIVSLALELALPTGREQFGEGGTVFEPFIAFGQLLPRGTFAQAQAGVALPYDRDRLNAAAFWRATVGVSIAPGRFGRMWSPMLEALAFRELLSNAPTQWNLVPQMQVTLNRRRHVRACAGVDIPLVQTDVYKPRAVVYLLWDWWEGGVTEGW